MFRGFITGKLIDSDHYVARILKLCSIYNLRSCDALFVTSRSFQTEWTRDEIIAREAATHPHTPSASTRVLLRYKGV